MWCAACQQDVPAISALEGGFACARCGGPTGRSPDGDSELALGEIPDYGIDLTGQDPVAVAPPAALDDWNLEDDIQSAQSVLRATATLDTPAQAKDSPRRRFDPPQLDLRPLQAAEAHRRTAGAMPSAKSVPVRGNWLAWLIMSLGLMGLACGGVLLGWSLVGDRPDLWNLGLPIVLGGQCGLAVGLLLQLERLWQSGRFSQQKLDEVDQRLADLNSQTTLLGTTHSTASKAFYTHMVEGASPQVLLADVKGQLDMLAVRLGKGGE